MAFPNLATGFHMEQTIQPFNCDLCDLVLEFGGKNKFFGNFWITSTNLLTWYRATWGRLLWLESFPSSFQWRRSEVVKWVVAKSVPTAMATLRSTAKKWPLNFLTGWNISLLMVGVQKDRRCFPDLSGSFLHYFQVSNFSVYDWGVAIHQMGHWPLQNWRFLCLNIAPGKHSNAASNTSESQSMLDLTATWWDSLKMKGTPF